jgi:hypothetical protein
MAPDGTVAAARNGSVDEEWLAEAVYVATFGSDQTNNYEFDVGVPARPAEFNVPSRLNGDTQSLTLDFPDGSTAEVSRIRRRLHQLLSMSMRRPSCHVPSGQRAYARKKPSPEGSPRVGRSLARTPDLQLVVQLG